MDLKQGALLNVDCGHWREASSATKHNKLSTPHALIEESLFKDSLFKDKVSKLFIMDALNFGGGFWLERGKSTKQIDGKRVKTLGKGRKCRGPRHLE